MVQWTVSSNERRELGRAAGPAVVGSLRETCSLTLAKGKLF